MVVMDEFSAVHPNLVVVEDDYKDEEKVDNQVVSKGMICEYCGKPFGRVNQNISNCIFLS